MAKELEGKVAVVTGAASGIGLGSSEPMLAAGSCVVMVDRDEAALKTLCKKHGNAVIPLVIDLLDPRTALHCCRGPGEGRPTRHPACKRRYLRRRRPDRLRHWGYRPDDKPERQCRDEERPRRAASHDRTPDRRYLTRSIVHTAHSAAWHGRGPLLLRRLRDHCFGRDHEPGDGSRVLERDPNHFGRIDDAVFSMSTYCSV